MTKKAPSQLILDRRSLNIDTGWNDLAPNAVFFDTTYAQFHGQRDSNAALRLQLKAAKQLVKSLEMQVRTADLRLWILCCDIVKGVSGSAVYGTDSELYASFGLIPTSRRKSGMTRKLHPLKAEQLAQAAQRHSAPGIELPVVSFNGHSNGYANANGK